MLCNMDAHKSKGELDGEKLAAARAALRFVQNGMLIGLGSGSTAAHFITVLGDRLRQEAIRIEAVPSSLRVAAQAKWAGIPLIEPQRGLRFDLDVDGADEIAPDLALIKGGGGALTREKILARASRRFLVIADSSKLVPRLGTRAVPIEVVPFAWPFVADQIASMGAEPVLRVDPSGDILPFLTDQNNYILDCQFRELDDLHVVATRLDEIPGLVDHGLFLGYAYAALIADGAHVLAFRPGQPPIPAADLNLS
jgi:ribose 5-phosphate isomerase A